MKRSLSNHSAFTLIEIMLVVAIMVIALATSYPSISSAIHRAPLTQAVQDLMEGCRKARAMAILQGVPVELRVGPRTGQIQVANVPVDIDTAATQIAAPAPVAPVYEGDEPKPAANFSAQISDRVRVELVDVNFGDFKEADVARVRFNSNGTSDEFTIILSSEGEYRKVSLEAVTGLAEVESDASKFAVSR